MKIEQNKIVFNLNLIGFFWQKFAVAIWLSRQILVCLYQINLDDIPLFGDVKLKAGQNMYSQM